MKFLEKAIDWILPHYLLIMGGLTGILGALLAAFPILGFDVSLALYLPVHAVGEGSTALGEGKAVLNYSPLIQHWGVLLALVGFFMVAASTEVRWRKPAMAISGVEKLFVVAFSYYYSQGFTADGFVTELGVAVDFFGTVFSLLYFAVRGRLTGDGPEDGA